MNKISPWKKAALYNYKNFPNFLKRGFRLDHTTDYSSGIMPNEWRYITTKVDFYAAKRGQQRPVYLAEVFLNFFFHPKFSHFFFLGLKFPSEIPTVDYRKLVGTKLTHLFLKEFMLQQEMAQVVDIETEGYVTDMCGRHGQTKDSFYVSRVVKNTEVIFPRKKD